MKLIIRFFVLAAAFLAVFAKDVPLSSIERTIGETEYKFSAANQKDEVHDADLPNDVETSEVTKNGNNFLEQRIIEFLDSFRDVMQHGNENLPPMDPLYFENLGPYAMTASGYHGSISGSNINFDGVSWYLIDNVTFNPIRLTLGLQFTIPWINFSGDYDAAIRILMLNHRAGGHVRIFFHRVEFGFDLRMGSTVTGGGHLVLREFGVRLAITGATIRIDGLTGSSVANNLINVWIHTVTQDIINNQLDAVGKAISEQLFDTVNEELKKYTLADLIGPRP